MFARAIRLLSEGPIYKQNPVKLNKCFRITFSFGSLTLKVKGEFKKSKESSIH